MQHYFSPNVAFLQLIFAFFLEAVMGLAILWGMRSSDWQSIRQSQWQCEPIWQMAGARLSAGYNIALFGHLPALGCDVTQFWSSPFIFYK